MALRQIYRRSYLQHTFGRVIGRNLSIRLTSTWSTDNVLLEENQNVATLSMKRGPVNSLSMEMLTDLIIAMDKLESNKSLQGLVLTSSIPGIFCAGLNINELYNTSDAQVSVYWKQFQELSIKLYSTRLTTIAAINGHAPAAGCALTLACDYRIMADGKGKIGLNETILGFPAPWWLREWFITILGVRQAELSLHKGVLYDAVQALQLGIVDQVVDESDLLAATRREMEQWLKVPDTGRELSKLVMHQDFVSRFHAHRDQDGIDMTKSIRSPSTQIIVGAYLESLKNKKK